MCTKVLCHIHIIYAVRKLCAMFILWQFNGAALFYDHIYVI